MTKQIMYCWTNILLFQTSVVTGVLLHKQSSCKAPPPPPPLLSFLNVTSQNESACCFPPRHSSDKVSKLEGTVEHYKKKLEDMGLLRRQVHSHTQTTDDSNDLVYSLCWALLCFSYNALHSVQTTFGFNPYWPLVNLTIGSIVCPS